MPVEAFFASAVSGDAGFQTAQRTAGVYIVSSRKAKAAQLADLHSCTLRQVYQQMVDTRSHADTALLNAISENTDGYIGSI